MSTPYLPVELCTQIFEHFQLTSRDIGATEVKVKRREDFIKLHTLRNICLVSKSFHRIAWPILYRVFPFTSDLLEYEEQAPDDGASRDELYFRTLHRNPAYADALRFIYMDMSRPDNEYCINEVLALGTQARTSHVDGSCYVLQPGSRLKRFQGKEAKQGLYQYFLAVVLLMCRNVRGLHLASSNCENPESSLLDDALSLATVELPSVCTPPSDLAAGRHQILQKLRTISVTFDGDCYCTGVSFPCETHSWLFRILQSGSLKTLTLRCMFWNSLERPDDGLFVDPHPLIAIHLMHLTTLRLLRYGAGGALIASLVKCCPSLAVLEVEWRWVPSSGDYLVETQDLIAFDLIAVAIANYAPNLSTLVLDDSRLNYVRSFALPRHTFGRQLCNMKHLRTIRASESAFYTDKRDECILEALPKCLQSLSIIGSGGFDDRWGVRHGSHDGRTLRGKQDADLRCLLQDKSLPNLRRVCVNYHSYIDKAVCVQSVLDPQLVWARDPRDIYNEDIAKDGWELCNSAKGDATRELFRSSANDSNTGGL